MKILCLLKKYNIKFVLLLIFGVVLSSCTPCCLYPLARMFGGPPESELKIIRQNYERMRQEITFSKIAVYPACIINYKKDKWISSCAERIVELMEKETPFNAHFVDSPPDVKFIPVRRNQMRFMWDRARMYSEYTRVQEAVGKSDFYMFTDFICTPDTNCDQVGGVHVYVMDSGGNICYTTLINSHHDIFRDIQPDSFDDCCRMVVKRFLNDLNENALGKYPPYGVG